MTPGGSQQDHVDHNTCVLTTRTLQGAVLDLAVVPSDSKTHVVVSALPWSFPSLRGVALDTCHLPMEYEAVASNHGSAGSRLRRRGSKFDVSFPSEVWPDVDALEPFRGERNRQFTGDEAFFYDHLYRLPREHTVAAVTSTKSAEVWSGLAEWIRLCTPKR